MFRSIKHNRGIVHYNISLIYDKCVTTQNLAIFELLVQKETFVQMHF